MFPDTLQLQQPGWLWLLPPLWALAWLYTRRIARHSSWRDLCDPELLLRMRGEAAVTTVSPWLLWLLIVFLSLAVIGAAGPGWRPASAPVMQSANARIVVLDLSSTMLVEDVKPNRHAQAIAAAGEIIAVEFDGETGLVVYAGNAFKVAPLSQDSNTLLAFLDALNPGIMPTDGARLDLAIDAASELLTASVFGRGQIVVLTSGSGNLASALQAAVRARAAGHQLSILAVGSDSGGPLIGADGSLVRDARGRHLLSKPDFEGLARIAEAGNGYLVTLRDASGHDLLLRSRVEGAILVEADTESREQSKTLVNEGYWLVWLMLPLALLLMRKNAIWIVLLAIGLPQPQSAHAADLASIWRHPETRAFDAYQRDDFNRATELARSPMLQGAAFYRLGDFTRALESFSLLDSAAAHYNRGNSLSQLQRYDEAIEAYNRALELEADFGAARYNRRLLILFLEQSQEQGDGDGDDDNSGGDEESAIEQSGNSSRIGVVGQQLTNPADQQQPEGGLGASTLSEQVDPYEQFDGLEATPERFALREGIDSEQAQTVFDRWISGLPATSSDLFERKFLRDYQRQQRQSR